MKNTLAENLCGRKFSLSTTKDQVRMYVPSVVSQFSPPMNIFLKVGIRKRMVDVDVNSSGHLREMYGNWEI